MHGNCQKFLEFYFSIFNAYKMVLFTKVLVFMVFVGQWMLIFLSMLLDVKSLEFAEFAVRTTQLALLCQERLHFALCALETVGLRRNEIYRKR